MSGRCGRRISIALGLLFLFSFVPRAVYPVSRPLQWYERGYQFIDAVAHGRWSDTLFTEHPGVVPMWLIGLAQHSYEALRRATVDGGYVLRDVQRAFHTEVSVSVLPLAAVISLAIAIAWLLLRKLFGEAVAWAATGFLALDPFHIAISKVVHVDALLSMLMLASALLLLAYLQRREEDDHKGFSWFHYRLVVASGAVAGLAFLTKSPAYFLFPYVVFCLVVTGRRGQPVHRYVAPFLLWAGAAAAAYLVCWPAMWVQPGRTLAKVISGIVKHTGRAHPQPVFYLGRLVSDDPGPGYYLVSIFVKTTAVGLPLAVIGFFSPVAAFWRRKRREIFLLIAYVFFFLLQMSLAAKKAPRYLLPVFPVLDILSGIGLVTLVRWFGRSSIGLRSRLAASAALAVQAILVLPYHPYFITHANLLAGGPAGARDVLIATPEGEGLDVVARYLNGLPRSSQLRVGAQLPAREALRQYLLGEVTDTREPNLDYVVFSDVYVRRRMFEEEWAEQWEIFRYQVPDYTASLRRLPYAWAYEVREGPRAPATALGVCVGGEIVLIGHTILVGGELLSARTLHPGQSLQTTLHWLATGRPAGDYSVFVHLRGPDGALVAQQDNAPLRGTHPTHSWEAGERVDDPYELTIPLDARAGTYELSVGMYDWRTGDRLPALADCAQQLGENRIVIATLGVEPERMPWWQVLACIMSGGLAVAGAGHCLLGRRGEET